MSDFTRIHLDPVGGLAGDMFAAALADAFPELIPGLLAEIRKLGPDPSIRIPGSDPGMGLAGRRFVVEVPHAHEHVAHRAIRERLQAAGLEAEVLRHALALFALLAEAEGEIHGIDPEAVEFHELGALDSIADFVAAAFFIARLGPARWSFSPLPLGGGTVKTAHGVLPVPAPATALLLRGLDVVDDGIGGERVTPTGAAIARYLRGLIPDTETPSAPERIAATGHGFGSRALPGMPNFVRCMAFVAAGMERLPADEEVAVLGFEVDDQTAEDLALALDRIRAMPGVLDACQLAAYGKKGRLATHVQVLARPEAAEAAADLCLAETTTLGVRIARMVRRTLARRSTSTTSDVRVKIAERPGGRTTAKAESDDIARIAHGRAEREAARASAESEALDPARTHGHPHRD